MLISVVAGLDLTTTFASTIYTSGDYRYLINSDGNTATIYEYTGSDTEIVIPSTIDGYTVTILNDSSFEECVNLISVTIPDSVTEIRLSAFASCTSLENVTFGSEEITFECPVFSGCTSLKSITLPDNLTNGSIGIEFLGCTSLEEINVNDENALYSSVDGVLFSKDQTELVKYPQGKTDIEYVILDSVTSIGNYSFYKCTSLESVTIPDSVTSIGNYSFYECTSLESVTIPDSVISMGNSAFHECTSIVEFNVDSNNGYYSSVDGVLYNKDQTELICYPPAKSDTKFTVSDSVTSIYSGAFYSCESLKRVVIGSGVETLSSFTFESCNLSCIVVGENVTEIKYDAFYDCGENEKNALTVCILNSECEISDVQELNTLYAVVGYEGSTAQSIADDWNTIFIPIDDDGHAYSETVTKATCEEEGSIEYVCYICEETYTETTEALGHDYQITKTVDSTCTKDGYVVYTCSNDSSHTYTEILSATGHSYTWTTSNGSIEYECSVCGIKGTLPFTDISDETEYYPYIAYTSCFNSLITGVKANSTDTTTTTFSPRTSLTRAMLVTILYRMAGSPYDDANPYSKTPFSDVKAGTWYYNAVCWALDNGITTETKFKPNTNVTREQTATFLYRYAGEYLGEDVSTSNSISSYPDATSVSAYAETAMKWANEKGMITGTQQGYLNPQGTTLRVHATKILYNFGFAYNIGNFS